MEHGMNCPHHADKDEACTCALTERTMHAAWRKRAEEAETRIAALESQVKALTAERDQAIRERGDAQRRYTTAMHDISKACAGTTAWSACEVVELWREDLDAQAEAVRVLGGYVRLGEVAWDNNLLMWDSGEQEGSFPELPRQWEEAAQAVNANPIARAAVEGGA